LAWIGRIHCVLYLRQKLIDTLLGRCLYGLVWLTQCGRALLARGLLTLRAALLVLLLSGAVGGAFEAPKVVLSAQKMGPAAMARTQALLQEIADVSGQDDDARLKAINTFFNRNVLYRDDRETWGVIDYWASPLETLAKGQGDCEDYAIGKYFSLLAAGMPSVKMRLVYVRAQLGAQIQAHMVLAYYPEPNAEPLILDNLITEIRPASRRPDLVPVFSFNAEGLWQGVGGAAAGDPSARLSRWRDVLAKAKAEGWW
jgi:predicted transglutaminase-like cysteine proteinase